jgi:hypothetical protein
MVSRFPNFVRVEKASHAGMPDPSSNRSTTSPLVKNPGRSPPLTGAKVAKEAYSKPTT